MKEGRAEKILAAAIKEFKKARIDKGLSHDTLAKMVGITRPAISYIESGKCKPNFLHCLKIAEALDVSLGDVIKRAGK